MTASLRCLEAHRGVFVRLGGPTLAPQCDAMNGTLLVVEAERIDDVIVRSPTCPTAARE